MKKLLVFALVCLGQYVWAQKPDLVELSQVFGLGDCSPKIASGYSIMLNVEEEMRSMDVFIQTKRDTSIREIEMQMQYANAKAREEHLTFVFENGRCVTKIDELRGGFLKYYYNEKGCLYAEEDDSGTHRAEYPCDFKYTDTVKISVYRNGVASIRAKLFFVPNSSFDNYLAPLAYYNESNITGTEIYYIDTLQRLIGTTRPRFHSASGEFYRYDGGGVTAYLSVSYDGKGKYQIGAYDTLITDLAPNRCDVYSKAQSRPQASYTLNDKKKVIKATEWFWHLPYDSTAGQRIAYLPQERRDWIFAYNKGGQLIRRASYYYSISFPLVSTL